jgi:hypothetical protein
MLADRKTVAAASFFKLNISFCILHHTIVWEKWTKSWLSVICFEHAGTDVLSKSYWISSIFYATFTALEWKIQHQGPDVRVSALKTVMGEA